MVVVILMTKTNLMKFSVVLTSKYFALKKNTEKNQPQSFQKWRTKASALTAASWRHFMREVTQGILSLNKHPGMSPGAVSACSSRGKL